MLLDIWFTLPSFILACMDNAVWVSIFSYGCVFFIALGTNSSSPFPYLIFLKFTLLVFPILIIQRSIPLREILCSCFVICYYRCLLIFLWISGQQVSPLLPLSSDYWMSVSMALATFSLLWIELTSSPLEGFLVELSLHSVEIYPVTRWWDVQPLDWRRWSWW